LAQLGEETPQRDPVAAFEKQLGETPQAYLELTAPDLVKIAGRERAEALLTKALTMTTWKLLVPAGDDTRQLAREITLKHVDQLKSPPWHLVDSAEALALYEALDKRFPLPGPTASGLFRSIFGGPQYQADSFDDDGDRTRAAIFYLAGLIAAERIDDATALVRKLSDNERGAYINGQELITALAKTGSHRRAYEILRKIVSENPSSRLWQPYLALAAEVGKSAEALETVKTVAAKKDLKEEERQLAEPHLVRALLAADETAEAISRIRGGQPSSQPSSAVTNQPLDTALELARLGILLEKPDLAKEGIDAALSAMKDLSPEHFWGTSESAGQLAAMLRKLDRGPEAAELLIAAMQKGVQAPNLDFASRTRKLRPLLIELLATYHRAGRHADIVSLIDKAPYWGYADLAGFIEEDDADGRPVGYYLAAALAATDRKAEARKIVEVLLDLRPGYDPAYELLVQVIPDRDEAMARLDALVGADRFEERPLIWKADLLRAAGRLVEAEQTARKAIAIDPSDGEQPRGDRMRAYAVLASILEAKIAGPKTAKEAQLYRNVVKAIRMSEDADQLHAAGLLRRAVRLYKQSLAIFADAYCIQSRLAVQLAESGDFEAAEPHYRKAYELMPDSFGRVESHCFGCEGAFRGTLAQKIAEEVFTRLAKERPDKPQTHYLLGYLREQQGRYADAVDPLRRAVKLDPDYLNAWTALADLPQEAGLPPAEREAAAFNIIRLDPRQRHSHVSLHSVRDARALWAAVERAATQQPVRPTSLYALPAATEALKANGGGESASSPDGFSFTAYRYGDDLRSPAHALLAMPAFQTVARLLEME
jgi:tetratricopeptide (TPR) repeat protein